MPTLYEALGVQPDAEDAEIKRMPTFILYELGEVADKTEGPFIDQFEKMLARNFDPKA